MMLSGLKVTPVLWVAISSIMIGVGSAQSQTVIKFSTDDGMSIVGTLHLPQSASRPVAGVILFA